MTIHGFAWRAIAAAGSVVAVTGSSHAAVISASLLAPIAVLGTVTPVLVQSATVGSTNTITGPGFSVSFSAAPGTGSPPTVAQNTSGVAAVPVAGAMGSAPEYLTGDYGSSLTTSIAASGKYLTTYSTGTVGAGQDTVTIAFAAPQAAFLLLWGSIDGGNELQFYNGSSLVATETGIDADAAIDALPGQGGFTPSGSQGVGGSAYIMVSGLTFTSVVASSSVPSFELTAAAGVNAPSTAIPEPASLLLLSMGLFGAAAVRRRC